MFKLKIARTGKLQFAKVGKGEKSLERREVLK